MFMYYYCVYDINDNLICYLDNAQELVNFSGIRSCDINYRFKGRVFIVKYIDNVFYKIYRFLNK